jgi:hypothetical protein
MENVYPKPKTCGLEIVNRKPKSPWHFGEGISIAQPFTAGNKSGHEPRYKGRERPFSLIKFRRFDLNF